MNASIHILKTDSIPFCHTDAGKKLSEVRFDDRGYAMGDYLFLKETKHTGEEMEAGAPLIYTGHAIMALVTHIHAKEGMEPNWMVLSIRVLNNTGRLYGR